MGMPTFRLILSKEKVMKPTFKAYVAGFFDGEGCVMIRKDKKAEDKIYYSMIIVITQKHPMGLFDELMQHFGGSKNWRAHGVWQYQLSSTPGATKMLMKIAPYVKLKRDQVFLAIIFGGAMKAIQSQWATRSNPGGHRVKYSKEIIDWQETCYRLLREWKNAPASETERMGRYDTIRNLRIQISDSIERMRQSTN